MRRPPPQALAEAAGLGDLAAALAAVGGPAGADFRLKGRDPRQDLQYGESLLLVVDAGPYKRARAAAEKARKAWPRCAGSWLLAGAIEACLARPEKALPLLERAAKLDPLSRWAAAWRGVALALDCRRRRSERGLREALHELDRALSLGAPDLFVRPWTAELRHDLDEKEAALADLARLPAGDVWARVERGEILCECGRAKDALAEFTRLTQEKPREAWTWALRGRTLATSGRADEALPDLDRAARLAPRSAAVRAWRAEALRRLGRYREARAELDRATRLDPRFTLAWIWRGRLKLLAGRPDEALADLDRAVRLDPRYRLGVAWRGEALFKLGRRRAAARDFAAVAPLDPRRFWNAPAEEGAVPDGAQREQAYLDDMARARR